MHEDEFSLGTAGEYRLLSPFDVVLPAMALEPSGVSIKMEQPEPLFGSLFDFNTESQAGLANSTKHDPAKLVKTLERMVKLEPDRYFNLGYT